MTHDLARLLRYMPPRGASRVDGIGSDLVELALDLGRPPMARTTSGYRALDSSSPPATLPLPGDLELLDLSGHQPRDGTAAAMSGGDSTTASPLQLVLTMDHP